MSYRILPYLMIMIALSTVLLSLAVLPNFSWSVSAQGAGNSEGLDDIPASTSSTATTTADARVGGTATHFSGAVGVPGDRDWIKVALSADQMYRFALKGRSTNRGTLRTPVVALYDSGGNYIDGAYDLLSGPGRNARLHYYVTTAGDYWVSAGGYSDETGTYRLRVVAVPDDTEPDNTSTPGQISVGSTKSARLDYRGDTDWFRVDLVARCTYPVSVSSNNLYFLPGVRFFNSQGALISVFHDQSNYYSWSFTPRSSGTYYIAAYSRLPDRGGTGKYNFVLDASIRVSGLASTDYAENGTSTVATYAATGAVQGSNTTWSLSGDDSDDFSVSSSGALAFSAPPDYESPADSDSDNVYEVTVKASDGTCSGALDVAITVTDVNEPRMIMGSYLDGFSAGAGQTALARALVQVGNKGRKNEYNQDRAWYATDTTAWHASGELRDGSLAWNGMTLTRVLYFSDTGVLRFNEADDVHIGDSFAAGGANREVRVWLQTEKKAVSFLAKDHIRNSGSGYINFETPMGIRSVLGGVSEGDLVIFAVSIPEN